MVFFCKKGSGHISRFSIQTPVWNMNGSAPCVGDFSLFFGDIPGRRNRERAFPLVGDYSPFFGDIPGIGKCAPRLCPAVRGWVKGGYPVVNRLCRFTTLGKGMRDKNPYGFFRAPYFPPLVLFLLPTVLKDSRQRNPPF